MIDGWAHAADFLLLTVASSAVPSTGSAPTHRPHVGSSGSVRKHVLDPRPRHATKHYAEDMQFTRSVNAIGHIAPNNHAEQLSCSPAVALADARRFDM